MRWTPSVAGLVVTVLSVNLAWAQGEPQPVPKKAQDTIPAGGDKMSEARAHYERGLQLYDEGAYDGARVEFARAYELAPTYRILYNIGLVQRQESDYVGALKNFEAYLEEGGNQVPDVRRTEVTKEIAALKARIGSVTVTTNVPDADVTVDDVPVGKSPLKAPVLVNPGRRKISATKAGRQAATQVVEIASTDRKTVNLDLTESQTIMVVQKPARRVPWVGWVATGVLAVGAGITGYAAIKASSDLSTQRDAPNADPSDLQSRHNKVKTFSIIADVTGVAAIVVGGISLFYTVKWGKEDSVRKSPGPSDAAKNDVDTSHGWVKVGPQGLGFGAIGAF